MDKKAIPPKLMYGKLYFVESFNPDFSDDIHGEYEAGFESDEEYEISRGIIIPNGDNERIKFDFDYHRDFYSSFFTGFLYSDKVVLGKIKYIKDANTPDASICGTYIKMNENWIIIRGFWTNPNNAKFPIWIDLYNDDWENSKE